MKRIVCLLALLFLAAPIAAQEPLSPPAEYKHKAPFDYGRGRAVTR